MKAAVLYQIGKPLAVESDIEVPALQPGQVLVEVAYSGVCQSQLMEVRGKRGEDRYLPHLLGHEASGTVRDIGEGVFKIKSGDKVILTWIKGEGADCAGTQYRKDGITINSGPVTTFSDVTVVSENRCIRLPEGVPMDLAPLLGCAIPTGAGIITNILCPRRENTLTVFGMGGVGLSAVMAAKAYECSMIIAVDIEDHKLYKAKDFGATHLINSSEGKVVDQVFEMTGGKGVDFSIEAVGRAQVVEAAFQSVRDAGGLCIVAGHPDGNEKAGLKPHDLIRGKQIQGAWGGESMPDCDIPLFARLYLDGKLPLEKLVSHRYKLKEVNQALIHLEERRVTRALLEFNL